MSKYIFLLSGKKQSGKNVVSNYLANNYDFTELSFAEELKNQVCDYIANLGIDFFENGDVFNDEELKKQIIPYKHNKKQRTYRELLQVWGTEFTREFFNDNIWAEIVAHNIKTYFKDKNIVISDWRFSNEFETIKKEFEKTHNIVTIKIQRDSCDISDSHISENALRTFKFDYSIDNNETIEKLYDKIDKLFDYIISDHATSIGG